MPARALHGSPLKNFARPGEDLVVIYHVQIFREYLTVPYLYSYGGSESPPNTLGDMNEVERHFKAFIAWDNNELIAQDWGFGLGDQPQSVSETLFIMKDRRSRYSEGANTGRLGPVPVASESRDMVPCAVEGMENNNDSIAGTQCLNESGGRRFSRFRGNTFSFDSAPDPPRLDNNRTSLKLTGSADDEDRTGPSHLICSESQGLNDCLSQGLDESLTGEISSASPVDDDVEESTGEQQETARIYSESHNRISNAELCPQQDHGSLEGEEEEEGSQESESSEDPSVEPKDCDRVLPLPHKRTYVYHYRNWGLPTGTRDLRKRRKILSQCLDNPFLHSGLQCCKSLKCFESIDPIFAFRIYKKVMTMNREDYKSFLIGQYDEEQKCFVFQGQKVCARYLQKGFGFSNDLQCSVKATPGARAGPAAAALPRLVLSRKRELIINFLKDYAEAHGDMMPNAMFVNLPEVRRRDVYEKLKRHCQRHFSSEEPPSLSFFYAVWSSHCKDVRTRRHNGFAKCEICIFLKSKIAENQRRNTVVRRARKALRDNLDMVKEERRMYRHRSERARKQLRKYTSIVVDGADQKSFGLPHFLEQSKSDRGHKLKVKCIGCLQHASINKLRLFIMTDGFLTGANHIIEVVHRTLSDHKREAGRFSQVLYVQADNCTSENKNRYTMSYFEMLVALGVFVEVEVSFLPIGHTHTDIDQTFSSVSNALKRSDAPTMEELISLLRTCYNARTAVERLTKVANFSGLCEENKNVMNSRVLRGFTQFGTFDSQGRSEAWKMGKRLGLSAMSRYKEGITGNLYLWVP